MANNIVTGDEYIDYSRQIREIERQLLQESGYPFSKKNLRVALQNIIEGKLPEYLNSFFGPPIEFSIKVPLNYIHEKQIETFKKNHQKKFNYFNGSITDENFSSGAHFLEPGKVYTCKIYPISERKIITSLQGLEFIKNKTCFLAGAQELCLAWSQKKENFPIGKWVIGIQDSKALWVDQNNYHGVPRICGYSNNIWRFDLGRFEDQWDESNCLLCMSLIDN